MEQEKVRTLLRAALPCSVARWSWVWLTWLFGATMVTFLLLGPNQWFYLIWTCIQRFGIRRLARLVDDWTGGIGLMNITSTFHNYSTPNGADNLADDWWELTIPFSSVDFQGFWPPPGKPLLLHGLLTHEDSNGFWIPNERKSWIILCQKWSRIFKHYYVKTIHQLL